MDSQVFHYEFLLKNSPVSKSQHWDNKENEDSGDGSKDNDDEVGVAAHLEDEDDENDEHDEDEEDEYDVVAHHQLEHPLVLHHVGLLLFGQDDN